jgi:hypothetical protein
LPQKVTRRGLCDFKLMRRKTPRRVLRVILEGMYSLVWADIDSR